MDVCSQLEHQHLVSGSSKLNRLFEAVLDLNEALATGSVRVRLALNLLESSD